MSRSKFFLAIAATAISIPLFLMAQERVDLSMVQRIRAEAFENSKVMDHLFYLTDVYGPRVANSPAYRQAADWVVKRMQEYGISAKLEKWDFGRGWTCSHYEGHMLEPQYSPIIGFPLVWAPGTNGDGDGRTDARHAPDAGRPGQVEGQAERQDRSDFTAAHVGPADGR